MFNHSNKPAFGVDVSDVSIKIVQLKGDKKQPKVDNFIKEHIPAGVIDGGIIKKTDRLADLIKQATMKAKLKNNKVVCNLPEEKVFVRIIQLPEMKLEEVDKAIRWESEAYIPMNVEDVYLSWQLIDPIDKGTDHLNVLVAAAPKNLVDNYVEVFKKANLKLLALEPESAAVVRSLIKPEKNNSSIIVDLGATASNFVIFSHRAIRFTSQVPISGMGFNQAICQKLGVSEKEAERLKIKVGLDAKKSDAYKIDFDDGVNAKAKKINSRNSQSSVNEALLPAAEKLADQIEDYITFYHNNSIRIHEPDGSIDKILLCGGDSLLVGLPEFLQGKLNRPVRLGNPLINISQKDQMEKPILYATALGLSLHEFI